METLLQFREHIAFLGAAAGLVSAVILLYRHRSSSRGSTAQVFVHAGGVPRVGLLLIVGEAQYTTDGLGLARLPVALDGKRASLRDPTNSYRELCSITLNLASNVMEIALEAAP